MKRICLFLLLFLSVFAGCQNSSDDDDPESPSGQAQDDDDDNDNNDDDNDDNNDNNDTTVDPNEGWATGYNCRAGIGFVTHYQNEKWALETLPEQTERVYLYALSFPTKTQGWAVGSVRRDDIGLPIAGLILRYENGEWLQEETPARETGWSVHDIHMLNTREGWAIGGDSATNGDLLMHYIDGAWQFVEAPALENAWHLESIHVWSDQFGHAAGYYDATYPDLRRGLMLVYDGVSWQEEELPEVAGSWTLNAVVFNDEAEGWAAGFGNEFYAPVILHYFDGAWRQEDWVGEDNTCGEFGFSASFSFIDRQNGWLVESENVAARYAQDGWHDELPNIQQIVLHASSYFNSVATISAMEMWAVGASMYTVVEPMDKTIGLILHFDKGEWKRVVLPDIDFNDDAYWELTDVAFPLAD
ncbi:MAG: hypothetical protein GX444_10705 [Myxococcales bacterium]|nr:hypothetical protein [Myxococcales bacterium]